MTRNIAKKGATIDSFNEYPCNADMHCIALIAYNMQNMQNNMHDMQNMQM